MKPDALQWTIDELGTQVALALSVDYEGSPSSRVRDVPDRRTIRYYTTLGLIDRPEMRGRVALYRRRHLVQLVAIKRLQARGLSLAEVQRHLLGLTNAALVRLARVPNLEALAPGEAAGEQTGERGSDPFWAASPTPVPDPTTQPRGVDPAASPVPDDLPWQGVPLGERALLLFEPSRPLKEEDLAALRSAAAPLLDLLESRRLLRPGKEREPQ
jgi:hypothetical protein